MTVYSGDYLGFTFNDIHSSVYNITRTSGGNRFDKILLPNQKDDTVDIPGADGVYFFKSNYQPLTISVPFAYDNLSESDLQGLARWLGDKQTHNLIFDELPYKEYQAKLNSQLQLTYIPFDENSQRVYKGEGSIQFQIFYPFAKARYKTLIEYSNDNATDWSASSRLLNSRSGYDSLISNTITLYNPGDIDAPLTVYGIKIKNSENNGFVTLTYSITPTVGNVEIVQQLVLDASLMSTNNYIKINSGIKLLQELSTITGLPTGSLYNYAIAAGDFIYIKPQVSDEIHKLTIEGINKIDLVNKESFHVDYDYIYR